MFGVSASTYKFDTENLLLLLLVRGHEGGSGDSIECDALDVVWAGLASLSVGDVGERHGVSG